MADGAFLDTGGLLAALNKDDDLHESATAVLRRLEESGRQVVTTNFVLAEVGNGLARTAVCDAHRGFCCALRQSTGRKPGDTGVPARRGVA